MSAVNSGSGVPRRFQSRVAGRTVTMALAVVGLAFHPGRVIAQGSPQLPTVAVGRPVVLDGELDVLYEDNDNGARLLHFLKTANGRVPLRFQGDAPDLRTGSRVRVSGNLADGTVTTTSVDTVTVSTARTLGTHNALVILVNFSNNSTQPYTPASTATVNEQVKNFYLENSYGQTFMTFNVAGWFTIAATNSTCDYYKWASQADAAATNAGFNLAAYDRYIYAFPQASACSWWGMGNVAGPRSWVNGSYALRVVAHEQGHNYGNHHSHSLRCDSSTCTTVEYGDDRDILGASGVTGHMNAYQKERLGWLNYGVSPTIQTVSTSGDYWIENYETGSGGPKALKIWNPTNGTYYYVESRAKTGFDSSVASGVTLHGGSPTSGTTNYQIDLAPTTTTWDSTLDLGQLFQDDALGLNIETLSTGAGGALIRVVFGTIPCTIATPTVSVSPSAQSGGAGYAVQYGLTVTNNDASTCAPAPFSVWTNLPSGWSSSVAGSGLANLVPGASTTATLTVTATSGSSGSYAFNVNASDNGSGLMGSAMASLTVMSSLDVTASASATSGKGNRSVTVSTVVQSGSAAVSGARVSVTLKSPSGGTSVVTATTAANGTATVKYSLKPKDPSGTYQIQTVATINGATGSSTTTVNVK